MVSAAHPLEIIGHTRVLILLTVANEDQTAEDFVRRIVRVVLHAFPLKPSLLAWLLDEPRRRFPEPSHATAVPHWGELRRHVHRECP